MNKINNISVSDMLAEKLKISEVGALLDEAGIAATAREVVLKAFLVEKDQWGQYKDSALVKATQEMLREHLLKIVSEHVAKIAETPEFRDVMNELLMISLRDQARTMVGNAVSAAMLNSDNSALQLLKTRLSYL